MTLLASLVIKTSSSLSKVPTLQSCTRDVDPQGHRNVIFWYSALGRRAGTSAERAATKMTFRWASGVRIFSINKCTNSTFIYYKYLVNIINYIIIKIM